MSIKPLFFNFGGKNTVKQGQVVDTAVPVINAGFVVGVDLAPTVVPVPTSIPVPTATPAPVPTSIPFPTATPAIVVIGEGIYIPDKVGGVFVPPSAGSDIDIKLSWYWPPFGGINCGGNCELMANGENWRGYVGRSVACPLEFPFGTIFQVEGAFFMCRDRGGDIKIIDGVAWLDFLYPGSPFPAYGFGQVLDAVYWLPNEY